MLSEDDRNIRDMTDDELAAAWDLWFDLAQTTNDADPPYAHGVFAGVRARLDASVVRLPPTRNGEPGADDERAV